MDIYQQNENVRIEIWALDSSKVGVTGASLLLTIKRSSDGRFWNGATFQVGATSISMTESDASGFPGLYHYNFNTNGLSDDFYTLKATTVTASVVNAPFSGRCRVGGFVDVLDLTAIADALKSSVVETEGSYTLQQALSIILAACAGRTTDLGVTFKTPNNVATRISATVNSNNERTAITLTPSS